ncbi:GTP-binding protein [Candidatus Woesearchaeota archaeon]|jgi:nucleolar GTP-binding protein|nr:GTP-binding protein [Candidatus Woesearchaeota archaeon]
MNFQKIAPVEKSQTLLDLAFRKARVKGKEKNLKGNWLQVIRQKEGLKLDVIKDVINPRLEKVLDDFPRIEELSPFYQELMMLTLDRDKYKKSLATINGAIKRMRMLHKSYVSKLIKCKDREKIKELSRQAYGRLSSVVNRIEKDLLVLEHFRRIMKDYPDIKDMFTVCIYGFPNVGKTTLLNKLTGTKAQVAKYAFTTKRINSGHLVVGGTEIQILDVPGTLARPEKMNDVELQAELVVDKLADLVIYVFDVSEYCGYSLEKQEQLFKKLGKRKKTMIYLSKTDLFEGEDLEEFKHKYNSLEEIKEKLASLVN